MRKLLNEELERLTIEEFKSTKKLPLVVILDNVRSMNNIGSIFRTSDAFLVDAVYLCGISATPPNKDIHKTALGATESVDWYYFKHTLEAIDELKENGYVIAAIEQTEGSISLDNFSPRTDTKYAIILGHEVRGIEQKAVDRCDLVIEISQFGTKHSLNISVCAGIVIWEFFKKMYIK
ncbi:MAG: RNA methyltransferase [Bacteroidales bacterium]|nr:RNA methyltransferase [Bacteroidales bacterium]